MNIKAFIIAVALALAATATADFRTVKLAHEVALTDLRLPSSASGTIGFRACAECEFRTERVTAETLWSINGRRLSLADFRTGVARVTKRDEVYVTVIEHLEEDRVTEVSVNLR